MLLKRRRRRGESRVDRRKYQIAKVRHAQLVKVGHAYFFALVFYGLLFGWARTGNPGMHDYFLHLGGFAEDLLAPIVPAVDNVFRDCHDDGYGHRAAFARHVAAAGWLGALVGGFVFFPMMWKDRKMIKRRKSVLFLRSHSSVMAILQMILCCALCGAGALFFWLGDVYNEDQGVWVVKMMMIRKYDLAAGWMMAMPFGLLILGLLSIMHLFYGVKTARVVFRLKRRSREGVAGGSGGARA